MTQKIVVLSIIFLIEKNKEKKFFFGRIRIKSRIHIKIIRIHNTAFYRLLPIALLTSCTPLMSSFPSKKKLFPTQNFFLHFY